MKDSINHRVSGAIKAVALVTAGLLVTLSAQAGTDRVDPRIEHRAVVVSYADLNLATTAGAQTLYARIGAAAQRACGSEPAIQELRARREYRACRDAAVDHAVKKVDSQRLQALHEARQSARQVG